MKRNFAIILSAFLALLTASQAHKAVFTTHICSVENADAKCPIDPRTVACPTPNTCFISAPVYQGKQHTDHVFRLKVDSPGFNSSTPVDSWECLENQGGVDLPTALFHISSTENPDHGVYAAGVGVLDDPSITYTPAPGLIPFQPASEENPRILSLGVLPNQHGDKSDGIRGALYDYSIGSDPEMGIIILAPSGGTYGKIKFRNTLFASPLAIAFWTDSTFVMVARENDASDKQIIVMVTADTGRSWKTIHRFPLAATQLQLGSAKVVCGTGGCIAASGSSHADLVFISFEMAPNVTVKAVSIDVGTPVDVLALALAPSEEAVIVSLARPVGRAGEHAEASAVYLHSLPSKKEEPQTVWEANGRYDMTIHKSQIASEFTGASFSDAGNGLLVGSGKGGVGVYTIFSRV